MDSFGEDTADGYDAEPRGDELSTVEFLAELARGGPALELAIGTGRVALPLAARGIRVDGIDLSPAMVAKLRAKPGGEHLSVTMGDFADVPVEGSYPLIFIVFDTLFNLLTQEEQDRCFENVAAHLTEDGLFVVEAFVPSYLSRLREKLMQCRRRRLAAVPSTDKQVGAGFEAGEEQWRRRLGALRQIVRQELVARQLQVHLPGLPPRRVLDVGCGQGTQVIRLARLGHQVTGLDSSSTLLADLASSLRAEEPQTQERVHLVRGDVEEIAERFRSASFDAVLCHGVLMYFADPNPLLGAIARVVAPEGIVSLLVRNGDALAMRPGLLGDWPTARHAFDELTYDNRIGVTARADRLTELTARLAELSLSVRTWYGVRVFTDIVASEQAVPDAEQLAEVLACEERAGSTDPYRAVAALLHVIAGRIPR